MNKSGKGLGFRLIAASFLVVAVFISIAGLSVYKISQDAIKEGARSMVRNMAEDVRLHLAKDQGIDQIADSLMAGKIKKSGSVWIIDREGQLLFHPDPLFREEYINRGKSLGNVVVSLQFASPRPPGTGAHKEKLVSIIDKYDEGFGKYKQYGEERIIAFQVLQDKGWLIGLDEPVASAESELARIKRYIVYTGIVSAVLIMAFTWLAIRIIIKPYYREVEDLNLKLQATNKQVLESNRRLEESNKKLTTLYEISIAMQETLSLQDILDMIIRGAQEVLNVDRINVMLPNQDETFLECRAAIGAGDRLLSDISVPISSKGGALAAAYRRGQVIKIDPGEHFPPQYRLPPPYDQDEFLKSSLFVIVPMVVKNKPMGTIAVDNRFTKEPLAEDTVSLLQIFANQAAVAVENARLYEELRRNLEELDRKVDQLSIVNQISNTMQKMVDRKEMLGFILRGIKESMGFDSLMVCLIDREENVIKGELGLNVKEEKVFDLTVPLEDEDNPMVETINNRLPRSFFSSRVVDLVEALSVHTEVAGLKISPGHYVEDSKIALAVVPLMTLEEPAGLMALARTGKKPAIFSREMELLMLFANTAGLAVERAGFYERLHEDIESLEITDQVTRLFTFKYGQQRLREELIKSRESRRPFCVAVIGMDEFKAFNERCGQELGDRALGETAGLIKRTLSGDDLIFRYGGRLISCILPGKQADEVKSVMEELRRLIEEHRFHGPKGINDQKLTVSIGLVGFDSDQSELAPGEILKMSMGCLHRAEADGGNKVVTG